VPSTCPIGFLEVTSGQNWPTRLRVHCADAARGHEGVRPSAGLNLSDVRTANIATAGMKRVLVSTLAALVLVSCSRDSPKVDHKKYGALDRAGRATHSTVTVSVNDQHFREAISFYTTAVSLAKDHPGSQIDQQFVALHEAALTAYTDSLTLWNLRIASGSPTLLAAPPVKRIVDDYGIPYTKDKFGTVTRMFEADGAIQTIWRVAGQKLDAADALYRGEAPAETDR
jgi:hypothetical protein